MLPGQGAVASATHRADADRSSRPSAASTAIRSNGFGRDRSPTRAAEPLELHWVARLRCGYTSGSRRIEVRPVGPRSFRALPRRGENVWRIAGRRSGGGCRSRYADEILDPARHDGKRAATNVRSVVTLLNLFVSCCTGCRGLGGMSALALLMDSPTGSWVRCDEVGVIAGSMGSARCRVSRSS